MYTGLRPRHYAFSRQHITQFSEQVYAFVLWRYVAMPIWCVKELFVPGTVASTLKAGPRRFKQLAKKLKILNLAS